MVGQVSKAQSSDNFSKATNEEIKSFLNEVRHVVKAATKFRLSDKPYGIPSRTFLEKIATKDTLLAQTDVDFIIKQVTQRKNTKWSNTVIDSAVLIRAEDIDSIFQSFKVDSGWKIFRKTYGGDFYRMSFPYFSQDKQTCIIYIGHYCGGLCGEGGLKIFRRQNNTWRLIRTIGRWVS